VNILTHAGKRITNILDNPLLLFLVIILLAYVLSTLDHAQMSGEQVLMTSYYDPFYDTCGDGFLDSDEECDDGNRLKGDGCSSFCRFEVKKDPSYFPRWITFLGSRDRNV
jgi:cysteine-rich repeat protein